MNLDELLNLDPDECDEHNRTLFDRETRGNDGTLVFFGASTLGRIMLDAMRARKRGVLAFADNRPLLWGTEVDGVEVLSPRDAVAAFPAAAFVVTIYHDADVRRQLAEMGCRHATSVAAMIWKHDLICPTQRGYGSARTATAAADEIRAAFALLADEESRQVFLAQLQWRMKLGSGKIPARPPREAYFPADLFALGEDEVFIDGGAYDGDSIRDFLSRTGGKARRVVGIEPDPVQYGTLLAYAREHADVIETYLAALSGVAGEVPFLATGRMDARISDQGTTRVESITLDDLAHHWPTFVKLDIEGYEAEVLQGGRRMIAHSRPVLAVCAYHKYADLWEIPRLLHDIAPDFSIHLHAYSEGWWELICYAVPPERLRAACPRCRGRGKVFFGGLGPESHFGECPDCLGTGTLQGISSPKREITGASPTN